MKQHVISIDDLKIGNELPFTLLAGPCAMESRDHAFDMAGKLKEITDKLGIPFVYKSSFDKANRTSINSKRGIGLEKAMEVFDDLRKELGVKCITDIHTAEQCSEVAKHVDIIQIPAFLCRQTDLLVAAAKAGKPINVKKGQFMAPWDMEHSAKKISDSGNKDIMLCERGATFGYNTLVNDMRSLPIMASMGYPVVFDATHSVQQPSGQGGCSGGDRTMVPYLARAAVATGIAAVFMEVHQDPDNAPCDGPNMLKLDTVEALLEQLVAIDKIVKDS